MGFPNKLHLGRQNILIKNNSEKDLMLKLYKRSLEWRRATNIRAQVVVH